MAYKKRNTVVKRSIILFLAVLVFVAVFSGRLLYVQVTKEVDGRDLEAIAESRWTTTETVPGSRGSLLDRSGSAIAEDVRSYTLVAIISDEAQEYIEDPEVAAEVLAPLLDMDESEIENRLSRDLYQVELGSNARYLSLQQKNEIEEAAEDAGIEGIHFRTEASRYYPNHEFASHVTGYVDRNGNIPSLGLESSLDDELTAQDGKLTYRRDARGFPLLHAEEQYEPEQDGYDVQLTLDQRIQTSMERAMSEVEDTYNPEKIMAVAANPSNGEIYAISNRPSFNPNTYENITNYTNYAVSDRIEPGSTMKMFTLAAAIEEGVYDGEDMFQSGQWPIGGHTVSDHNEGRGWGEITYNEGFARSSNVAFAKIAKEQLGRDTFYDYIESFGFTSPTGVDLPREAESLIANQSNYDTAATAFGQASAFTPMQLVHAATAIANDGEMVQPYVIDGIYNPNQDHEPVYQHEPVKTGEPISPETAAETRERMQDVVEASEGTGTDYYLEGFDVIGKTGTAQIPDPEGGYLSGSDENIFSFLGMAPKDDPQVLLYVAVDRPELEDHEAGSEPVAQIFNTVMQQSLQYLDITPDVEEEPSLEDDGTKSPDVEGMTASEAKETIEAKQLTPLLVGEEESVTAQVPEAGEPLIHGERVMVRTNQNEVMPDMTGWSLRETKKFAELFDLDLHYMGTGFVEEQSIEVGAGLENKTYLTVDLNPPDPEAAAEAENEEENEGEETESSEERRE